MGWPFSYNAKPSDVRNVLESIQGKCSQYANEAFWQKIMASGRFGASIADLRKHLNDGVEKGNAAIGYMSELYAIRDALRTIDLLARNGGRQVDPRAAGDAFGVLFNTAGTMLHSCPQPYSIYGDVLCGWAKEFGNVAEMLVGHNPTKRGMGVTQRQAQTGRDQGWNLPDSQQFAR